jgi:hypothetical protein
MSTRTLLGLALASMLIGCSDDSVGGKDAAAQDAKGTVDAKTAGDTKTGDATSAGDAKSAGDAGAVSCNQPGDPCPGSLTCLCCGAIGPKSICLCTKECKDDGDCDSDGLPSCNKASSSAASGICTPTGFNCCWLCQ